MAPEEASQVADQAVCTSELVGAFNESDDEERDATKMVGTKEALNSCSKLCLVVG